MRAFTRTDVHTDIQYEDTNRFAHLFITYTPVGLHTNTC